MQISVKPSLLDIVRVEKIDSGLRLVCGERYSDINQAGAEIIELMDGAKSLDDIARSITEAHKSSEYTEVYKKVELFIHELWKRGIYLNHDIDTSLIYKHCRIGDYAVAPSYCMINDLPMCYLSPCYNEGVIKTVKNIFKHSTGSYIRVVHFNSNADVDQCVLLLGTNCRYTFALHSIYGKIDNNYLTEMKDSIIRHLSADEDLSNLDNISILKFYRDFEHNLHKNEKIAYTLSNEFPDSDLVVTETLI